MTDGPFDWVTARAECSAFKVFKELQLRAEADVATRNRLRAEGERVTFIFDAKDAYFVVIAEGRRQLVRFLLTDAGEITVSADGFVLELSATLTLNNDGECRLKVQGTELTEWQFMRMALEVLFFG